MKISIINHTSEKLGDEEVQTAVRAINRQLADDFEPYWSIGAELRLEGHSARQPDKQRLVDLRGDAIIYLWDGSDVDDALGYHDANAAGIPFGFVFTDLTEQLGENWTVTLSHEALELVADANVNILAAGPHPAEPTRDVFHWYEMCDAVQAETYEIDHVEVSNFVLPLYFTASAEEGARNDFLGRAHNGQTLPSFGVNPGGYVGFWDPELGKHDTYRLSGDETAERRLEIKKRAKGARRAIRYQRLGSRTSGPAATRPPSR